MTPLAPVAAGRTDCPQDWVVYVDSQDRFSICYPADFGATASDLAINLRSPRAGQDEATTFGVILSWAEASGYSHGLASEGTCPNYTSGVEGPLSSEFVEVELGGRQVPACLTVGPIQSSLHGAIALATDGTAKEGYISFSVNFVDPDLRVVPLAASAVLETLLVGFR